jgi:hypothetical protein
MPWPGCGVKAQGLTAVLEEGMVVTSATHFPHIVIRASRMKTKATVTRSKRRMKKKVFVRRIAIGKFDSRHRRFFASLTMAERMLLAVRDELYDGSWAGMLRDLRDRLKGPLPDPAIVDVVRKVREDMARIRRLRDYETKHKIDLTEARPPLK